MVVLKGVPALLSPELLYALARMGHGDEIGEGRGQGPRHPRPRRGPDPGCAPGREATTPQAREEPGPGVEALLWPPRPTSQ